MKKSLLAVAVASAATLPVLAQADATLYGRLHFQMQFDKNQDMNIANAGHRLGVKGESELDSGLTAFYQLETQFGNDTDGTSTEGTTDANLKVRHANAGVKGDFGKVTVGRFENPMYKTVVGDVFERTSAAFTQTQERIGNSLAYESPSYAGFNGYAAITGDGGNEDFTDASGVKHSYKDVDGYVAGVNYEANGLYAGVGYAQSQYEKDQDSYDKHDVSVGVSYTYNNAFVGANYEHNQQLATSAGATDGSIDVYDVAATYTIDKTTIGLNYSQANPDNADKLKRSLVGVYHDLGGGADVYAEYYNVNGAAEQGASDYGIDALNDGFTVGYRVKF